MYVSKIKAEFIVHLLFVLFSPNFGITVSPAFSVDRITISNRAYELDCKFVMLYVGKECLEFDSGLQISDF